MPKTKTGEKITWSEFGKRWRKGIEGITPLQQLKGQIQGTWITIAGIAFGIIVSIIALNNLWWVLIILIGALIVTGISMIGMYQKKWMMQIMENGSDNYDLNTMEVKNVE